MERLTIQSPSRHFVSRWRELSSDGAGLRPITVALAASFTVEPLLPYLGGFLAQRGLLARFSLAPFNQIYQALLDPAGALRASPADVAIVLPRVEELCGRALARLAELDPDAAASAHREGSAEIERLAAALGELERATGGKSLLFCGTLPPIASTPLGPYDASHPASQRAFVAELNLELWRAAQRARGLRLFDLAEVVERVGRRTAYDARAWHVSRCPFGAELLKHAAYELSRAIAPLFVAPAKVVVLDLDNTLWGGVVGEDGPSGIALGEGGVGGAFTAFQEALLALRRQGVLLCVASKNNEPDAFEVIDRHPGMRIRREHLAAWRIGWQPKSQSLEELAKELGVGLSSFVFLDDSPVEREEVRRMLPEVTVVDLPPDPSDYVAALRSIPELDRMALTAEDYRRADAYAAERARAALRPKDGDADPEALRRYLESLELRVRVRHLGEADVPRAAQLTQKTNQFNLTTIRRTEAEIEALRRDPDARTYVLEVSDRFDDYGLTGLAILRRSPDEPGAFTIDTLLLSCRVLGRGVETALLAAIASDVTRVGATRLYGTFVPTAKNAPAAGFLDAHGFRTGPNGCVLEPIEPARYEQAHVRLVVPWSDRRAAEPERQAAFEPS